MTRTLFMTLCAVILALFAPSLHAQTVICVPQFADGMAGEFRWRTTVSIFNPNASAPAGTEWQFFGGGGMFGNRNMARRGGAGMPMPIGPGGGFNPDSIRSRAWAGYRSAGDGPLQAGGCLIQSQDPIRAHVMFHLYDGAGNLISEGGYVPRGQFTSATIWVDPAGGGGIGLALTNPSLTDTANVTLEFLDVDGNAVLAAATITLGPRGHDAQFVHEIFPELGADTAGQIRIVSTSPICGVALQIRGTVFSEAPFGID